MLCYLFLIVLLFIFSIIILFIYFLTSHYESFQSNAKRFNYYTLQNFTKMTQEIYKIPKKFMYKFPANKKNIPRGYFVDMNLILKNTFPNIPIAFKLGDVTTCQPFPVIQKTRPSLDRLPKNCKSILLRLNSGRHFQNIKIHPIRLDTFLKKKSIILWRGSSTGPFQTMTPPLATRAYFVLNYFNKYPFLDIGISNICQDPLPDYHIFRKRGLTRKEHEQYKYIVSIQGNDVASNLKWLLASSSLIFMCKPTVASWFMEDTLIPFKHYILLRDDFSDIEQKFLWAENNPEKCITIIENAHRFVSPFLNIKNEKFLMTQVVQWYKDNIKYTIE